MNTQPTARPGAPTPNTAAPPPPRRPFWHWSKPGADVVPARPHVLIFSMLLIGGGVMFMVWHLYREQAALYQSMALQGTSIQVETIRQFRQLYSTEVATRATALGIEVVHDYESRARALPLPATLTIELGEALSRKRPGAHIRLYSDYPFPWRRETGGARDDFEAEALRQVRQHPDQPFYRFEEFQGRASLRYAVADRMQASCVACHNSRADSPKRDWKEGDVRGVLEFIRPLDNNGAAVAKEHASLGWTFAMIAGMFGVGLGAFGFGVRGLRRGSESLRQSEEHARAVIDNALDAVVTVDSSGHITGWNPGAEAIFGWTRTEVMGRGVAELIIPLCQRETLAGGLQHFLASGEGPMLNQRIETTALHRAGHEFPIELSVTPLQTGNTFTFSAFIRDITEQQRTEDALRETRVNLETRVAERTAALAETSSLLEAMLESGPDCIYFKDRASRFMYFSKSFRQLFQLKQQEELKGKSDFDFFTQEHAQPAYADEQEIIRTGQPMIGKTEKETHADGRITWALTSKMPWRDKAGDIIGTFGVSKNITALKDAEAGLAQAHKELLEVSRRAGMAEVATEVLHNVGNVLNSVNVAATCIAEGIRKSKAANLAKVVALFREHEADLGNYLTHDAKGRQVPGYLAQLADHIAQEQAGTQSELAGLQRHIDHIKDIVARQQNFAKVSSLVETITVAELLDDALKMNAAPLSRHEIQVVKELEDLPPITVEKHKVLQILINLVRNAEQACDATNRADKQLTLRVRQGGDRVRISVSDNGVGIPPENLTRIFNHGFTTKKDGHGFGLHSAANFATEMGGTLTADSKGAGQGAEFVLDLPLNHERK